MLSIVASQAPSAALNLVRTTFDSQTQVKFSWSAPLDDGGDMASIDYKVYSDLGDQSAETEYALLTASTGQLQEYTATGLETAKTYFFKVVAFTLAAEGPPSEPEAFLAASIPQPPVSLAIVSQSEYQIKIGFASPTDLGGVPLVEYRIFMSDDGENFQEVGVKLPTQLVYT